MHLVRAPRVDATAAAGSVTVTGGTKGNFTRGHWAFPSLTVTVDSDTHDYVVTPGDGCIDVSYSEATPFTLSVTSTVK